jgi:hypothetical protein
MLTRLEPYMTLPSSGFYALLDADERKLLAALMALKAEAARELILDAGGDEEVSREDVFNDIRRLFEEGRLVLATRVRDGKEQCALVARDSEDARRMTRN